MISEKQSTISVFLGHAESDRNLALELVGYLANLTRRGEITVWAPYQIKVGEERRPAIMQKLHSADLILFLVSKNLLATESYEEQVEESTNLKRPVKILPLIADACDWQNCLLGKYIPIPLSGFPVTSAHNPAQAWDEVTKGVRWAVEDILALREIEPEPHFRDEESRQISESLRRLRSQRTKLTETGQDTAKVVDEYISLKRQLREKGQLREGDLLSDRFSLLSVVGHGGFGQVWRAYDLNRRSIVAVKVLHSYHAGLHSQQRERFERGARQMAAILHPAVARVLDPPSEDRGYFYYTMEYLAGGDLHEAVLAGRLSYDEKLKIFFRIASALEFAHRQGIIHRDVKPSNILLTEENEPKLTDFDLVYAADTTGGTRTALMGSFIYSAPEALLTANAAQEPADVYSLGMTILFALYGSELPFAKIFRKLETFLKELHLPYPVRQVIAKAIETETDDRWTTIGHFRDSVREALSIPPGRSDEAILRIDLGVHTAPIWRLATDSAERFLVTGSDDKTIRLWNLDDGTPLRVFCPPLGPGNQGKIFAVAISPDGLWIAAGGFTGSPKSKECIYIFDRTTGKIASQIEDLPNVTNDLVFSPDGSRLAATLGGTGGVWIFSCRNWDKLFSSPAGADSYGASYTSELRLITTSCDGYLRLFNADHQLLVKVKAPSGQRPFGVSFSPARQEVAVGYDDSPKVDIFSGRDLKWLFSVDTNNATTDLASVAWSADGEKLYAGGRYSINGQYPILLWSQAGRGSAVELPGPAGTILDLHALSDGRLIYAASDPALGILSSEGKVLLKKTPLQADFRGLLNDFRVSPNGRDFAFAFERGKAEAYFSLSRRRIEIGSLPDGALLDSPRVVAPGLEISGWESTDRPRLNGQDLNLESHEWARSLAISVYARTFLLGTEWRLRLFGRNGKPHWERAITGTAWAVNLTRDGRLAVAAFGDGTIRFFRASDGRELLAFFPHLNRREWILWTPGGYYDASPGGEELIVWHVSRGPHQAAELYPALEFRENYYRPDVIDVILETLDEAEAVRLTSSVS